MDKDSIKNAEARVTEMQEALDEAQRVLQAADRAQQKAEESAEMMRNAAIAAGCVLALLMLVGLVRRRHRRRDVMDAAAG